MSKRLKIAAILCFGALAPVALLAEGETGFLGPNLWMDPAPATYQLQATGTNLCAARTSSGNIIRKPYLSLQNCNAGMFDQMLQFVPNKVATQVIPATSTLRWRMTNRGECATVARNVVFGPPAVDMLACDLLPSANGNAAFRGGPDQSFVLRPLGRETVHIRYPDGRCWTVQGGNLAVGTQLVMEPCDGRAGQTFSMKFQADVDEAANDAAAELFGWFRPLVGAVQPGATAVRFRSLRQLDMMGGDYDAGNTATPNDRGASCARRCVDDNRCRAFTWVNPTLGGGEAKCFVKDRLIEPTFNANTNSGIVRPR